MGHLVKAVTDASFATDVLAQQRPVMVDFWAEWCGPCRLMSPMLESMAEEQAERLAIVKINVDENPEVTARYSVMSLPAIHIFNNGKVVKSIVGFKPKSFLSNQIEEVFRSIDEAGSGAGIVPAPGQG